MVSWAGEPQLQVFHLNLICNTVAPTSHLHQASMEVQDLINTQQVPLKDANKDNLLVSLKTNQDRLSWVVELIRRPWEVVEMREVLGQTMRVKTIIQATASHRSWVSSNQVLKDLGITMVRVAKKMMMTMMLLCLRVVTITVLPPHQLSLVNHP